MGDNNFYKIVKELETALKENFKGFLIPDKDGSLRRVEVQEGELHIVKAMEEMSKVPGWKYTSGIGQNPIEELMKEKRAIYVSRFDNNEENDLKVVAYIVDEYTNKVEYRGKYREQYRILGEISTGLGYDVDEYGPVPKKNGQGVIYVPIKHLNSQKGKTKTVKTALMLGNEASEGDKPVFDSQKNILGFIRGGKFVRIEHYRRYSPIARHFSKNTKKKETTKVTMEKVVKNAVKEGISSKDLEKVTPEKEESSITKGK